MLWSNSNLKSDLSFFAFIRQFPIPTGPVTFFELAPTRERSGTLTSIGYPGSYPASSLMRSLPIRSDPSLYPHSLIRATIVPPMGLRCVAEVVRADFGGDCREQIGSKSRLKISSALIHPKSTPDFVASENAPNFRVPCPFGSYPTRLRIPRVFNARS